ncbi:MAG: DMT family transporter [Calditrichaeota bacterium]|nr:MAG: DMT family transporter [Calditrichota bacterium]
MPRDKKQALLLLLITSVIWGASFLLIKKGLAVFTPLQTGLLRITFAMLAMLPVALTSLRTYLPGRTGLLLVAGLCGNLLPALFFALAETRLDSGLTGVLNALTPLFTLMVGFFFFRMRHTGQQVLGMLIGLGGAVFLSFIGKDGLLAGFNAYALLVLAATFLYGFNINFIKRYLTDIPSIKLTALSLLLVGLPALLIFLFTDWTYRLTLPGASRAVMALIVLGVVNTALALILFFRLLKIASPVVASSVTYIIPVIALLLGSWDGEALGIAHILGMAMIFIGVVVVSRA